jgi:hypothetical protein
MDFTLLWATPIATHPRRWTLRFGSPYPECHHLLLHIDNINYFALF